MTPISRLVRQRLAGWAVALLFAGGLRAEVRLPALFSDGMVLQRDRPVPVWGTARPGETVTVRYVGQAVQTTAGADGRWRVSLAALAANEGADLVVAGSATLTVRNVAVGEVWVASGQSNMEQPLKTYERPESPWAQRAAEAITQINDPQLRMLTVYKRTAERPLDNVTGVTGKWSPARPPEVAQFSDAAFHFARRLRSELGVPVGIIHTSWAGSPAEAWTRVGALESDDQLIPLVWDWERLLPHHAWRMERFEEKYQAEVAAAKAAGRPVPARGWPPQGADSMGRPGNLWNGMVAPLIPFGMRGVIWYQGEGNAGRALQYEKLLPSMISDWRTQWGQGEFPFLIVQLSTFQARQTKPVELGAWPEIREAQARTLWLPNTGLVVASDLDVPEDSGNLHPHNKAAIGRRLGDHALATVYGKPIPYAGPRFERLERDGARLRLHFQFATAGLRLRPGAEKLEGFAIAGADQKWVWADAVIEGSTLVLSNPAVPEPVAVRYAWAVNPLGNLENAEGQPAMPFRTDAWQRPGYR